MMLRFPEDQGAMRPEKYHHDAIVAAITLWQESTFRDCKVSTRSMGGFGEEAIDNLIAIDRS